ncbi:MAG: hypothetical protein ACYC6V_07075 [Bacillota bacterium]
MEITIPGTAWIYPRLQFVSASATFEVDVTIDTTVDLHLGPGTMTIGPDTYNLTFGEGDLRVERSEFADPFEPFAIVTVSATRVVTATLRTDGTFFADGTGIFAWIQERVTQGSEQTVFIIKELNVRLVNLGQLYNVDLFSFDPPDAAEKANTLVAGAPSFSSRRQSLFPWTRRNWPTASRRLMGVTSPPPS